MYAAWRQSSPCRALAAARLDGASPERNIGVSTALESRRLAGMSRRRQGRAVSEAVLLADGPLMTPDAQAEAGQRVAWIYYVVGRDADAVRVADQWRAQSRAEWGGQAAWISGLAAWRMGDCNHALASFRDATSLTGDRELATAGLFWASRSAQACGRPREVQAYLRQAAARPKRAMRASPIDASYSGTGIAP